MSTTAAKKWEEVQKKAFTHWVNTQLAKRDEKIENLQTGFSSGVELITLVEVLSGKKIETKWTKKPSLNIHKINNCFIALNFLSGDLHLKNVTVSAEDLVNGEHLNLILGFCWLLLRNFQDPPAPEGKQGSGFEENLLAWVKSTLEGYKDLDFKDGFKSDGFTNGKAILALLNELNPGHVDYKSYQPSAKLENCQAAISLSQQHAGIPDIIDPEELSSGKLEDKNLVLYLSLFYNAYKEKTAGESRESLLKRLQELEEKFRVLSAENDALKNARNSLQHNTQDLTQKLQVLTDEQTTKLKVKEEVTVSLGKLKETHQCETVDLNKKIGTLSDEISLLKSSSDSSVTQLQNDKDNASKERDTVREELKKAKEQLTKEKEELQAHNDELTASVNRTKKVRAELEEVRKQQQENQLKTINVLRKHLLQHVKDMHVWKPLLEADREFKSGSFSCKSDAELEKLPLPQQLEALDAILIGDNKSLDKLVQERTTEAAEVVAVNIGKKKHRIKKEDPLDALQKQAEKPKEGKKEEKKEEKKDDKKPAAKDDKKTVDKKSEKKEEPAKKDDKKPVTKESDKEKAAAEKKKK